MKEKKQPDASTQMMSDLMGKLKGLKEKEFKILNTTFSVEKLPPMAGFELSEEIRINLIQSADQFSDGDGSEAQNIALFLKTIMGLPPLFIKRLMDRMFGYVQFQGKGTGVESGWIKLGGMEDMAFKDFEIIHIYEIIARALYINFSGSFSVITSVFPAMGQILKR